MAPIDLKKASGLPLKLDGGRLVFGKGIEKIVPEARTRERMLPVLKEPDSKAPQEFYYMYRGIHLAEDNAKIMAAKIRYDITILPPFRAGSEYNKTFGHYHPMVKGTSTWYPEVYEVLHGRALYLLQNGFEFLVFDARKGDKCIMLPGFGHVTVNPSENEVLAMANWVFPGFSSDYNPIEEKKGAEWYYTKDGFMPNRNYGVSHPIKLIAPKGFGEFGLTQKPVYSEAMKNPKKFEWLWRPEDFTEFFREYRET